MYIYMHSSYLFESSALKGPRPLKLRPELSEKSFAADTL